MTNTATVTSSFKPLFMNCYREWCINIFLTLDGLGKPSRCAIALEVLNIFLTRPYKLSATSRLNLTKVLGYLENLLPLTSGSNAGKVQSIVELAVSELRSDTSDICTTAIAVSTARFKSLICHYLMGESYYLWRPEWAHLMRRVPFLTPTKITPELLDKIWACRGYATLQEGSAVMNQMFPSLSNLPKEPLWSRDDIPWAQRNYFREIKSVSTLVQDTVAT